MGGTFAGGRTGGTTASGAGGLGSAGLGNAGGAGGVRADAGVSGAPSTGGGGAPSGAGSGGTSSAGASGANAGAGGGDATSVSLAWDAPAAGASLSGASASLRLTGHALVNVEVFSGGAMLARCTVAADGASATCSIDTTSLPNGAIVLTAHGWNSPAGTAYTSDADAGSRSFDVANDPGTDPPDPPTGVWPSGTDGLSRDFANAFGAWRGRPTTSNWINVHWLQWDWLTAPGLYSALNGKDPVKVWDLYAGWSGVMVLSMSMAGADADSDYDSRMRECANGNFDGYWRTFAQNAKAAGRTGDDTVVSLAHEFNGTWFKWNPGTVGLDVWKSCWRHVYSAIHQQSSLRIAWVLSATTNTQKGGDFSVNTAWDAYPGDEYVDIVGVNRYDFKMLGSATSSNWRDNCGNTQDICYAAKFARDHGKGLAVPEWSMDRGQYGYPDRPEFVQMMFEFFRDNRDVLVFEDHFDNGGSGNWNYYPESSVNQNSAERYRQLWKQ